MVNTSERNLGQQQCHVQDDRHRQNLDSLNQAIDNINIGGVVEATVHEPGEAASKQGGRNNRRHNQGKL